MILRIKPRIQDRLRRLIFAGFARSWLLFGVSWLQMRARLFSEAARKDLE